MSITTLTPAPVQWTIYEGATFKQQIILLSSGIGSTPMDLSNYSGVLTVRNQPTQDILLSLTPSNGGLTFGGQTGMVTVYIPSSTTKLLTWKGAVFDLLIIAPTFSLYPSTNINPSPSLYPGGIISGDISPIIKGTLQVKGIIY